MSSTRSPALIQALALHRAPRGDRPRPSDRLPQGMLQLIRIAAGEEMAVLQAQAASGEEPDALREAARFYIQQVMFAAESDSYRLLGVNPDVEDELMREHYRWLVRWLHPDRNPDQWEAFYADRVNRAWQDVRTLDRRAKFDLERSGGDTQAGDESELEPEIHVPHVAMAARGSFPAEEAPALNLRWVPTAIFGGLAVAAIAFVALFSALRLTEPEAVLTGQPSRRLCRQMKPRRREQTPLRPSTRCRRPRSSCHLLWRRCRYRKPRRR
jgi:curved DNA-binding protein CbpA